MYRDNRLGTELSLNTMYILHFKRAITYEAGTILIGRFGYGAVDVVVGMHSQTEPAELQRTVSADYAIQYPQYDAATIDKDIMLVKLSEKIELGDTIQPVCLPGQGVRAPVGTLCYTTGWGTLSCE